MAIPSAVTDATRLRLWSFEEKGCANPDISPETLTIFVDGEFVSTPGDYHFASMTLPNGETVRAECLGLEAAAVSLAEAVEAALR